MLSMLAVLCLLLMEYSDARLPGKTCKIPNGDAGTCTVMNKCTPLFELGKKRPRLPAEDAFIRQSVASCGSGGAKVKVCCPPLSQWQNLVVSPVMYTEEPIFTNHVKPVLASPEPIRNDVENRLSEQSTSAEPVPLSILGAGATNGTSSADLLSAFLDNIEDNGLTPNTCGIDSSSPSRIVGGNATEPDAYPWLALLEYGPPKSRDWRCGGSLISKRHVLTAAHCLTIPPTRVRLAEYDLTTDPVDVVETDGGGQELINVTVVNVAWTVIHPEHVAGTSVHDVGVIKLTQPVEFSDFIKTICLPSMNYREQFSSATELIVAGWGSDGEFLNTRFKRSLQVPYVTPEVCVDSFTFVKPEQHLCAGGQRGRDSCRGDSGGPLMYEVKNANAEETGEPPGNFYIVGIVSSGSSNCFAGKPGVYMNVHLYVHWINRVIDNDGKLAKT